MSRDLSQYIIHVDCDAFYAAVEQLDRPELKDVPFAVGRGVLTTCNYVARQYGCRSGMAGFVAKKLCPNLILLKANFQKYTAKAHEIREVLAGYDPRFESASIDEAYLNITQYCSDNHINPVDAVEQMRREVHEKTHITVSAGIAANAKLAKICSNMNKPNGQFSLPNDRNAIMSFMRDLPTRKVNGIGRVLERELLEIGIKTCGEIYSQRQYLYQLFGDKTFEFLLGIYLGLGRTKIQPAEEYERKSVGTESTFGEISNPAKLRAKLRWIAEELEKDMKRAECKGRTLCLKVKLHTFEVLTRQVATPHAICVAEDLYAYSLPILAKLEKELPGMKLRLMGLRCTHLVSTKKADTMAFFSVRPKKFDLDDLSSSTTLTRKADDAGDPDCDYGADGRESLPGDFLQEWHADSATTDEGPATGGNMPFGRHGKAVTPISRTSDVPAAEGECWDCPICSRPQVSNERLFNEHIDLCLSRQVIRDTVHADELDKANRTSSDVGKPVKSHEKRRGRPQVEDPKQKRLCFG